MKITYTVIRGCDFCGSDQYFVDDHCLCHPCLIKSHKKQLLELQLADYISEQTRLRMVKAKESAIKILEQELAEMNP